MEFKGCRIQNFNPRINWIRRLRWWIRWKTRTLVSQKEYPKMHFYILANRKMTVWRTMICVRTTLTKKYEKKWYQETIFRWRKCHRWLKVIIGIMVAGRGWRRRKVVGVISYHSIDKSKCHREERAQPIIASNNENNLKMVVCLQAIFRKYTIIWNHKLSKDFPI